MDLKGLGLAAKKKRPAAMMRKAAETPEGSTIVKFGVVAHKTRSFLHVDECVEAVLRLMKSDFIGPVNIGSEEMVSINELAQIAIDASGKNLTIHNIDGEGVCIKIWIYLSFRS